MDGLGITEKTCPATLLAAAHAALRLVDDDDDTFDEPEPPGCQQDGCAVSFTCEDGSIALLLPLVLVRRRGSRGVLRP